MKRDFGRRQAVIIYKQTSPWHRSNAAVGSPRQYFARSAGIRVTWTRDFLAHFPRLLIDVTNDRLSHTPPRKTRALHHTRRNGCTLLPLLQLHQLRLTLLSLFYCAPHSAAQSPPCIADTVTRDETEIIAARATIPPLEKESNNYRKRRRRTSTRVEWCAPEIESSFQKASSLP